MTPTRRGSEPRLRSIHQRQSFSINNTNAAVSPPALPMTRPTVARLEMRRRNSMLARRPMTEEAIPIIDGKLTAINPPSIPCIAPPRRSERGADERRSFALGRV